MIPEFLVWPGGVVAQIDRRHETPSAASGAAGSGRATIGITEVGEFADVAFAADTGRGCRTGPSSVQVRLSAHALLVDEMACCEAIETIGAWRPREARRERSGGQSTSPTPASP